MSFWKIIEQFKTDEVEYIIAKYTENWGPGDGKLIDVRGYTKGTVSIILAIGGTPGTVVIQGSNDGTTFFEISPTISVSSTTTALILTWSIPVKEIRITTTAIAINIFLMATAGESGGGVGSSGGSSSCVGNDEEIIYNSNGFCDAVPDLKFSYNNAGSSVDPKYLNVGTTTSIGGFKRLSVNSANSWEDGHIGNSSQLIFTPTDFTVVDPSVGFGVDSSDGSLPYGFITSAETIVVAQKVMPKGFTLTRSTINIHTLGGAGFGDTLYVSGQSTIIGGTDPIKMGYRTPSTGLAVSNTAHELIFTDINPGFITYFVGDGNNMVTVYWVPGVQLTTANCITGMEITMLRI